MTFEQWCKTKGLSPDNCDTANGWIRLAYEGGRSAEKTVNIVDYIPLDLLSSYHEDTPITVPVSILDKMIKQHPGKTIYIPEGISLHIPEKV